jgi:hypothetical protein
MKTLRFVLTAFLAFGLLTAPLLAASAQTQDAQTQNQATALMRGYRTGYSDGYQAGVNDVSRSATREFRNKEEYQRADRAYASTYGVLEDYRDGYQQGFEVGYFAGFDRKSFDSTIPADLGRKGTAPTDDSNTAAPTNSSTPANDTENNNSTNSNSSLPTGPLAIPRDSIMRVELLSNLSTEASQKGDHFQVKVIEPKEYEGATIDGIVTSVKRPGRVKGTAELQLSFDEIHLVDGRSAKMSGQVIEVIPSGGSQGVGKVDSEGGVQGQGTTRSDATKVGTAAGIGAIIGAIAGGGVGAAVGATIGAGVGTAGVLRQRGKDIELFQGQHLRIRTAGDVAMR